jgi:hypothetical protein
MTKFNTALGNIGLSLRIANTIPQLTFSAWSLHLRSKRMEGQSYDNAQYDVLDFEYKIHPVTGKPIIGTHKISQTYKNNIIEIPSVRKYNYIMDAYTGGVVDYFKRMVMTPKLFNSLSPNIQQIISELDSKESGYNT